MIRAVVVDGHSLTRLGFKALLLATDVWIVGETGSGEEALEMVEELRPDLVTLGLNLIGEADGIDVCRRMKELADPPRVLIYSTYNFKEDVASCLLGGADSYVHKRTGCEELLAAIRKTADGGQVWKIGGRAGDPRSRIDTTASGETLTPQEMRLVSLMFLRRSNDEMARELHLSMSTVKTHVRNIMRKLRMNNRWDFLEWS